MKQSALYNKSVFVNFPFDPPASDYRNLFDALIFSIIECGFEPRCALERSDSAESRIEKIMELIKDSQYGIHDISCINVDGNGFPRFNMPFELGLFFNEITKRYRTFLGELPYICSKLKLNPQNLEFTDYHKISSYWVKNVKVV